MPTYPPSLVLIVDSDAAISGLLADVLKSEGYNTHIVTNGGAAFEFLATIRPQLILMGLTLTGITGEQLLALVRAQDATRDIPVVVMTARVALPPTVQLRANAIVPKPFELEVLLVTIARVLAGEPTQERTVGA